MKTFWHEVRELIEKGVLGPELCPDIHYWHWPVIKPTELPLWLEENYYTYGEIRWYPGQPE